MIDMTKGSEIKVLFRFMIPMLIGNLFQQVYNMVDSVIVGKYIGANALGAVGSVGSVQFFFFSLCVGLGSGISVLAAQYFGAGRTEEVKKIIGNAVYITGASGIVMGGCGLILAEPLLGFMNTPAANLQDALTYMKIVCGTTVIVAGYNTVSGILRALGDARTPLYFLIISSVINVILDLLFVITFGWGVAGAAWATVTAQFFALCGTVIVSVVKNPYFHLQRKHIEVDWRIIQKTTRMGIPLAAQNAMLSVSGIALQSVVNSFGTVVMAAYTAYGRVEQLVTQPYGSLGVAVSTFAGQNVGAGNYERVKKGCRRSVYLVLGFSAVLFLVMLLFGENIAAIFVNDPEVIQIGARGLRITSLVYAVLGMIYIFRAVLNGAGDVIFSMFNGIIEVVSRIAFAYILTAIPAVGVWGIWYTNACTWILAAGVCVIRYCGNKWKKNQIEEGKR